MSQEVEPSAEPASDEGFLNAVLRPEDSAAPEASPAAGRHRQARSGDRRWPAATTPESTEDDDAEDPRDAYLPDVVAPRIREALRGGQGLAGTPKRYGLLVITLVGLASLPTWVVMRAGLDDLAPAFSEPTGVLLAQPALPGPVAVRSPRHDQPQRKAQAVRIAPVRPHQAVATPASPSRVRVPERATVAKPPVERPVVQRAKPRKPAAVTWPVRTAPKHPFVRPVVVRPPVGFPGMRLPQVKLPQVRLPAIGRPIVRRPVVVHPAVFRPVVVRPAVVRPCPPSFR